MKFLVGDTMGSTTEELDVTIVLLLKSEVRNTHIMRKMVGQTFHAVGHDTFMCLEIKLVGLSKH